MKILFAIGHAYLPQNRGGLQNSIDQVSCELITKGHSVAVLASLMRGGRFGLMQRCKLRFNRLFYGLRLARDTAMGYPVWRTWFPWGRPDYFPEREIKYVIAREKPDVVVVGSGEAVRMAQVVQQTGVPVVMFVVDVEFQDHSGSFADLGPVPVIANSHFTADRHRAAFGIEAEVIYPLILKEKYLTPTTKENVTFINPISNKGLSLALAIAALCPEIPFSFVLTSPLPSQDYRELQNGIVACPNVSLAGPYRDMREVYGKCRILLAPSLWQEAYGRVVIEAQYNAIPVIASARGGLPEALGTGGILLDPDGPVQVWAAALRKLWQDDVYYADLSARALAHGNCEENEWSHKIEKWEKILRQAASSRESMTSPSSVAIIIPAYNAAATIERAIRSALAELEVIQIVVADDASNDDTVARVQAINDVRIKIIRQSGNQGPAAARNRAINETTAPWIGILDADDFFLPGRIKRLLAFAGQSDLVADDAGRVTENNIDGPSQSLLPPSFDHPRLVDFAEFVKGNVTDTRRQRGELGFIKPIMRREFLSAHNLRYQEHMRLGEDYEMYARALALGARLWIVPEQGYVSVVRTNSLSGRHTETDLLNLRDCDLALAQLPGLTPRDKTALRRHFLSIDCRLQWRLLIKAVKERKARDALATFVRPYPVPFYVLSHLAEQAVVRARKRVRWM